MTYPSGLRRDEAEAVAHRFGVALEQVHRDHLISLILAAIQAHADELIFFGGTALARVGGSLGKSPVGPSAVTFDRESVIVAQAVVWRRTEPTPARPG